MKNVLTNENQAKNHLLTYENEALLCFLSTGLGIGSHQTNYRE